MPIDADPIARLAAASDGAAFLSPHHLLAASRLERLIARARLTSRLTMSYDPARAGERRQPGNGTADLADSASHARQQLHRLAEALPDECWGVLFDVCGLGKGLQMVETERRWPRRSAKLVLRIGLSQLASHWGLTSEAVGAEQGRARTWRSERLPIIAESGF
ncbi:MAG: DUF6456 domain-containing protein [Devosia sp.]